MQNPAFATQTREGGRWSRPTVWCPNDAQPAVTMAEIRDQALRLLPQVRIGAAWTDTALVNAEVVLWADTGSARALPTVTIVGQQVALRIDQPEARWSFGDGTGLSTGDLGKPYDRTGDPCRTAQCADYFGHTYRHTGHPTITLAMTWHVHYRVGAGDWTDLGGAPLTGPTSRHAITVKQARGILVANPGQH